MEFGLAPDQSQATFEVMQSQARLAESLGYAALWTHEHHSEDMMYPDPLMALAALAPVTSNIKLGTSMLLLPIHHPVRVAQEAAMLDVLCGGRLCLGVANGYSRTDLACFGVSGSHRGRRLAEGISLIRDLWAGKPVTGEGDGYSLDNFSLFPTPLQPSGPPIYVGGHADVAVRRAAELGDSYFISTTAGVDQVAKLVECYKGHLQGLGKPFDGVLLNRIVCVTKTRQQKRDAQAFYARALLALYDSWGHTAITGLDARARSVEHISEANLIVGEASECLEKVQRYAQLGVRHIACLTNFGKPPLDVMDRSIRLLGKHLIGAI